MTYDEYRERLVRLLEEEQKTLAAPVWDLAGSEARLDRVRAIQAERRDLERRMPRREEAVV